MKKKHGFRLQEHFRIAKILKGHRDDLLRLSTAVYGHYPLNSKIVKKIRKARQAHENLISALEDAMLCENPSLSNAALRIYYPAQERIVPETVSRLRQIFSGTSDAEQLSETLVEAVNKEALCEVREAVCGML